MKLGKCNPLHPITIASVGAAMLLGTVSLAKSIQGDQYGADAWLIWATITITPGIAATSIRISQARKDWGILPVVLTILAFPILLTLATGMDVLDPDANHRVFRAIAALLVAASITIPGAANAIIQSARDGEQTTKEQTPVQRTEISQENRNPRSKG